MPPPAKPGLQPSRAAAHGHAAVAGRKVGHKVLEREGGGQTSVSGKKADKPALGANVARPA